MHVDGYKDPHLRARVGQVVNYRSGLQLPQVLRYVKGGGVALLGYVDYGVWGGEFVSILGRSGCGNYYSAGVRGCWARLWPRWR